MPITRKLRSLISSKRGNVLMITGLSIIPLVGATGMGIDYSRAARLHTKLNAAADAAALAAVSHPAMVGQTNTQAETLARNVFTQQATGIASTRFVPADLTISITQTSPVSNDRIAVIRYRAYSRNFFAGVFGRNETEITGMARARATRPPNIDFYLALDTSPSMALPTTTIGIDTMDSKVGCAFACHSNKIELYVPGSMKRGLIRDNADFAINKGAFGTTGTGTSQKTVIDGQGTYIYTNRTTNNTLCSASGSPGGRDICVYNSDDSFVDSYWYARNKGIELRVDAMKFAAVNLMTRASAYALENSTSYRAAMYTFDYSNNFKVISPLTSNLAAVASSASNVELALVNDKAGNGCSPVGTCPTAVWSGNGMNRYLFTSFASLFTQMTSRMPTVSGQGTNTPGDTPQAYLFMVTDGMSDENIGSGRTRSQLLTSHVTQCNALKSRGIKIAILYTEYTRESIADDEPGQRAIAEAAIGTPGNSPIFNQLTACASPGLMFMVRTNENISEKLEQLFAKAVTTARLDR